MIKRMCTPFYIIQLVGVYFIVAMPKYELPSHSGGSQSMTNMFRPLYSLLLARHQICVCLFCLHLDLIVSNTWFWMIISLFVVHVSPVTNLIDKLIDKVPLSSTI